MLEHCITTWRVLQHKFKIITKKSQILFWVLTYKNTFQTHPVHKIPRSRMWTHSRRSLCSFESPRCRYLGSCKELRHISCDNQPQYLHCLPIIKSKLIHCQPFETLGMIYQFSSLRYFCEQRNHNSFLVEKRTLRVDKK